MGGKKNSTEGYHDRTGKFFREEKKLFANSFRRSIALNMNYPLAARASIIDLDIVQSKVVIRTCARCSWEVQVSTESCYVLVEQSQLKSTQNVHTIFLTHENVCFLNSCRQSVVTIARYIDCNTGTFHRSAKIHCRCTIAG